jgi:hypothetical protein
MQRVVNHIESTAALAVLGTQNRNIEVKSSTPSKCNRLFPTQNVLRTAI